MKVKKNELHRVGQLITEGIMKWMDAGEILCSYLDSGGDIIEASEQTGLSVDILCRFEQIGRKQIHPRLLASQSPGMRYLSKCPYSQQEAFIDTPIEVLVKGGDSLLVNVDNLTSDQCKQVFSRGHVRSLPEQTAWVKSEEIKHIVREDEYAPVPYTVTGKKVSFKKGTVMTVKELRKLLESMI